MNPEREMAQPDYDVAPYCGGRLCFVHDQGPEHHEPPCPMVDTVYGRGHILAHELGRVRDQLLLAAAPEMERIWLGMTRSGRFTLRLRAALSALTARLKER